jgi:hypothetical protein
MRRIHLGVGLAAMLLTTNQVKALNDRATGYLLPVAIDQAYGALSVFQANTEIRYDTAIEAHQGGQDGGGALW